MFLVVLISQALVLQSVHKICGHGHDTFLDSSEQSFIESNNGHDICGICLFQFEPSQFVDLTLEIKCSERIIEDKGILSEDLYQIPKHHFSFLRGPPQILAV